MDWTVLSRCNDLEKVEAKRSVKKLEKDCRENGEENSGLKAIASTKIDLWLLSTIDRKETSGAVRLSGASEY
jgi:hypothetical protein